MAVVFSKGSGLNDSVYGKSYAPIKLMIEKKAEAFEEKSVLPAIFNMETSDRFAEKITGMTAMDQFKPVDEGGEFPENDMQEDFSKTFEHVTWKSKFSITEEMLDDAQAINLRKQPNSFVTAYYRTRELFGSKLVTNVGDSITFNGKVFSTTANDGLALYHKAHKSVISGAPTQSNLFSDTFSVDAMAKVENAMQGFKDAKGNILGVIPDTIIIPNHATLKKNVFAAIGADRDPLTANNGFNYMFGRWNVIVDPYWETEEDRWIMMSQDYNKENTGAVWFDRKPLTVKSDVDPATWNMIWQGRARFTAGFYDWRAFAMGGVTAGAPVKA